MNRPQGADIIFLVPTPTSPGSIQADDLSLTPEQQRININLASLELLDTLPGIGPVKAQAIVDYRERNGPFHRTDELTKVPGIGFITYQGISDLVTVGDTP